MLVSFYLACLGFVVLQISDLFFKFSLGKCSVVITLRIALLHSQASSPELQVVGDIFSILCLLAPLEFWGEKVRGVDFSLNDVFQVIFKIFLFL